MSTAERAAAVGTGHGDTPLPEKPQVGTSYAGTGVVGQSNLGVGVSGQSLGFWIGPGGVVNPPSDGVRGEGTIGVHGLSASGSGAGVMGENTSNGQGVHGKSSTGDGILGEGAKNGVIGRTPSAANSGVWGENTGGGYGVSGSTNSAYNSNSSLLTAGVWGDNAGSGAGLKGTSAGGDAVVGVSGSSNHAGVAAVNNGGGFGVWASGSPAGHFQGDIEVTGKVTAGDISGAAVKCLNGLSVIGDTSVVGHATIKGDLTTTGDIFLPGADCAEQFDITEAQKLAPGTVVVIDQQGTLRESHSAYDRKVAGVISGAGEYRPGIVLDKRPGDQQRASVALVGKVCCKVDAGYSPIDVGDLLTTSPTPGHAMKAVEPLRAFGSVIGKALRGIEAGQGLIPILIALQ